MSPRRALVLRPEPGNAATCARLAARGVPAVALPLFVMRALPWVVPDAAAYDALLLTSANAVRHAGAALATLAHLPVLAVGGATAAAAQAAGLRVAAEGSGGVRDLVAARGSGRLLHLAGRAHVALPGVEVRAVYASEPAPLAPDALAVADGAVALLHSPRAARAFAARLTVARGGVRVAAMSAAVADAAGAGWAAVGVAAARSDAALVEAAAALAIDP